MGIGAMILERGTRLAVIAGYSPSLLGFRKALLEHAVKTVNVVALGPDIEGDVAKGLAAIGVESRDVRLRRGGVNPLGDLQSFLSVRRALAELRPDVVLPYTIKPVIWGTLAAHSLGVKRIVPMITGAGFAFTDGGGFMRRLSRIVVSILYPLALRHASIVLFQNPDDLALFRARRLLPKHVPAAIIKGSGVDIAHYAPAPLPERPAFLMIARLLGDKGVREYAVAARLFRARFPDVSVRLVGWLDENPDSIKQAELDAMIASGVEFLGRLEDVRPAIAAASVYVLPSYREGTPRSTLEAMAMGRAVITTDAPGCRETVEEGVNGFLVPPRDAVALAAAMQKFMDQPQLLAEFGAQSRRIAVAKYDVNLVNAEIMRHAGLL